MGAWYKDFYLTTNEGEKLIEEALGHPNHGAGNRADIERRLEEMKALSADRCHITKGQIPFLERALDAK